MRKWNHNKILKLHPGIKPEDLPPAEDIKRVKRRISLDGRKLLHETKALKKSDE